MGQTLRAGPCEPTTDRVADQKCKSATRPQLRLLLPAVPRLHLRLQPLPAFPAPPGAPPPDPGGLLPQGVGRLRGRRQEQGPPPRAPLPAVRRSFASPSADHWGCDAGGAPRAAREGLGGARRLHRRRRHAARGAGVPIPDRWVLANFGKGKNIVLEGPREVTPTFLKQMTGLEAYLMGCPIQDVVLDPFVALRMSIQGQAATQLWDEKMEKELAEGHLSSTAFDRYCMILFAGIAGKHSFMGRQKGEKMTRICSGVCAFYWIPHSVAQMANRARWSVTQSYNLLKWHKKAHRAAVEALES